ncbi:hypothetical protein BT96DRAFT_990260 [Gymnopus androsaceus JB14]|uniref:Retrotransposon gag domain-containing protein n=1 Tax=Gymnopus androsaceus JB14 TaxID=1447944 RepID=A0A6A4HVU1_9AGAR|nr:hypothetical protein BT96DRAFT_990260 [Gymnopus androsaceus JB14]
MEEERQRRRQHEDERDAYTRALNLESKKDFGKPEPFSGTDRKKWHPLVDKIVTIFKGKPTIYGSDTAKIPLAASYLTDAAYTTYQNLLRGQEQGENVPELIYWDHFLIKFTEKFGLYDELLSVQAMLDKTYQDRNESFGDYITRFKESAYKSQYNDTAKRFRLIKQTGPDLCEKLTNRAGGLRTTYQNVVDYLMAVDNTGVQLHGALVKDIPCADKAYTSNIPTAGRNEIADNFKHSENKPLVTVLDTEDDETKAAKKKPRLSLNEPILLWEDEVEEYQRNRWEEETELTELEAKVKAKQKMKLEEFHQSNSNSLGSESELGIPLDSPETEKDAENQVGKREGRKIGLVGAAAFSKLAEAGCETYILHLRRDGTIHEEENWKKGEAGRKAELEEMKPKPAHEEMLYTVPKLSGSVGKDEEALKQHVPPQYHDFAKAFAAGEAKTLPQHRSYDMRVETV